MNLSNGKRNHKKENGILVLCQQRLSQCESTELSGHFLMSSAREDVQGGPFLGDISGILLKSKLHILKSNYT